MLSAQSPELELPRASVLGQLIPTPRVFLFMFFLMAGATGLGAKEVARWQYIRETFTSELGLGMAAAIAAGTVAITGLTLGKVIDQRDPRPFVLLAMGVAGIGNLIMGFILLQGQASPWIIFAASIFDGAGIGIGGVSLLKTQAAFVQPGAEGAAEIINILRLGLGGVLGAVLAGLSPDPALTLIAVGIALLVTNFFLWWVMRPVKPRSPGITASTSEHSLIDYLRTQIKLRQVVVIDLILALVIPTQLVNLVLFNLNAPQVASLSIAAGMVGVLFGRLILTMIGFRGHPRTLLFISVVGLAILQLLGALALTDGWLISQLFALPLIIILGTIGSTYAQGITSAMIQQVVAEGQRGRLASILVTGRNLLIASAATFGALVAAQFGSQVLLVVLGSSLLVVTAATRGFRAVPR